MAAVSLKEKLFRGHPMTSATMSADTAYSGASRSDARVASWLPAAGSADADLIPELSLLTPRSRDLARNSGLAGGYLQTAKDNIIGHQLRLMAIPDYRLLGKDKDWAREWGANTEAEFRTWADTPECDAQNTQTLWGKARLALGAELLNGDHVTLPIWQPRAGARWSTRLQSIESDRLSTPPQGANNPSIRGGVEIDDYGAPVRYWFRKAHPGDLLGGFAASRDDAFRWEAIPAFTPWGRRRVIHLHDKERDGQSRGAPVFTKVLREFRVSSEYVGHELHAAAANALIAAFIESDLPQDDVAELFGKDYNSAEGYWQDVSSRFHRKKLESGLFFNLPIGTKLSQWNPSRPNVAFGDFMDHITRYLAAGLNIPRELLMKDFSQTNYSSARAALAEAWRYFLACRRHLKDQYLDPIYDLWLEEAINLGRIEAPDFYENRYAYRRCRWIFAGRGWIDPVKEAQASQIRISSGLSTMEAENAEQGMDWEEVAEQKAAERARYEELGLPYPGDAPAPSAAAAQASADAQDEKARESA
jgi:lambda family phage portal protein